MGEDGRFIPIPWNSPSKRQYHLNNLEANNEGKALQMPEGDGMFGRSPPGGGRGVLGGPHGQLHDPRRMYQSPYQGMETGTSYASSVGSEFGSEIGSALPMSLPDRGMTNIPREGAHNPMVVGGSRHEGGTYGSAESSGVFGSVDSNADMIMNTPQEYESFLGVPMSPLNPNHMGM